MPYFMPNHLVTVSVPPMHLAHLGIDANDAKPPLIAQPTPTALGLGFAPGDVLVTVVADGMQHDVHRRRAAPAHRQRERPALDHRIADDARRIALPPAHVAAPAPPYAVTGLRPEEAAAVCALPLEIAQ